MKSFLGIVSMSKEKQPKYFYLKSLIASHFHSWSNNELQENNTVYIWYTQLRFFRYFAPYNMKLDYYTIRCLETLKIVIWMCMLTKRFFVLYRGRNCVLYDLLLIIKSLGETWILYKNYIMAFFHSLIYKPGFIHGMSRSHYVQGWVEK